MAGSGVAGSRAAGSRRQDRSREAGIRGRIATTPIGRYAYAKRLPDGGSVTCTVEVFPLEVETLLEDWPEKAERERRWFDLAEAAAAVREDGLGKLMLSLERIAVR